ncbi:hypothetical protein [Lysobacter sp. CA199]|uniref:hypothetical protein n=1 Tax=Lysobacter sp. CA199 TaxID=3455608 RepID=UPI003F8D38FE
MTCEPHWTAYVSAIAQPIVALLVACLAAWIAYRQYRTARNKLKLDLFDRRFLVYEAARKALTQAYGHGKLEPSQQFEYLSSVQAARWLFGPEVQEYLETTLWHKFVDLELYNSFPPAKYASERAKLMKWLIVQPQELNKILGKYLILTD